MTKEELKKEAEDYSNNWKINKKYKWNFAELIELRAVIYKAYKDGAEPREKQIEIDAIHIRALQKQNGELTDRLTEAREIIKELLNSCFGYNSKIVNYEVRAKAEQFLKENA